MHRSDITAERLRELLNYDAKTGVFTWIANRRGRAAREGAVAGQVTANGYLVLKVDGIRYVAHRLAWLHVHGKWPDGDIDHRNGKRADNRISNLRDVCRRVNRENMRSALRRNTTGLLGVCAHPRGKRHRFLARITAKGKTLHLGYFPSAEQAHATYLAAKRQLHEGNTL